MARFRFDLTQKATLCHPHVAQIVGLGGVEGDPQDEAAILIVAQLGAIQPAQGSVDTKRDPFGVVFALCALAGFEMNVGQHVALLPEMTNLIRVGQSLIIRDPIHLLSDMGSLWRIKNGSLMEQNEENLP